jgi:hypothetical protein
MSDVERIAELRRMLADATHDKYDTSTAEGTTAFIRSCARLGEAAVSSLPWLLDAAEARIEAEHERNALRELLSTLVHCHATRSTCAR